MGYCDWYKEHIPGPPPPVCEAKDAAGDAVEDAASDAFSKIVDSFAEGAAEIVKDVATWWMDVNAPTLSGDSGPIAFMFQNTLWLTSAVAVLGLLVAAGRMAWERRGEPAKEAAVAMIRMVLASTAIVAGINLAVKAGHEYSVWIINRATHCGSDTASDACLKAFTRQLVTSTALDGGGGVGLALLLVLSLLLIIASIVQIAFMLCRNALLIVLVGTLPLSAAASSTAAGQAWWSKQKAWLLAFVLYEPAAGTVYASAFTSMGTDKKGDTITQVSGVVLLTLAALTLPALMRVATPLVDSVSSGQKGAGAALAGAAGAVATGAIAIKTMGASKAAGAAGGAKGGASGAEGAGGGKPPGKPSGPPGGTGSSPEGGTSPASSGANGSNGASPAAAGSSGQSTANGSAPGGTRTAAPGAGTAGNGSVPRPTQNPDSGRGPRGSN